MASPFRAAAIDPSNPFGAAELSIDEASILLLHLNRLYLADPLCPADLREEARAQVEEIEADLSAARIRPVESMANISRVLERAVAYDEAH